MGKGKGFDLKGFTSFMQVLGHTIKEQGLRQVGVRKATIVSCIFLSP